MRQFRGDMIIRAHMAASRNWGVHFVGALRIRALLCWGL